MISLLKIAQNINEVDDDKTIEPKEVVAKSIKEKKEDSYQFYWIQQSN